MGFLPMLREAWERDVQAFEVDWWGACTNTFAEEAKQLTYARRMGLLPFNDGGRWPLVEAHGQSILDVGGGPTSLLLKTRNLAHGTVVDPGEYPRWTLDRYASAGIRVWRGAAEDYQADRLYDEAWCYNCLQHTLDPEAIVAMMRRSAQRLRIFEWVDVAPNPGHPHELKAEELARWLGFGDGEEAWFEVSEITWELNVDRPQYGGRAFHGYIATGL